MLRIILYAAVVGVFAFAISIAVLSKWRSWQYQHNQAEQKRAAEKPTPNGGHSVTPAAAEESSDKAIARYNLWLMIFTGLLAAVGIIQIGFLISSDQTATETAKAAKESADVARSTLIAANRPWVTLNVEIDSNLSYDAVGWDAGTRWHIPITYVATNIGTSPATDVAFFAK